MIPRRRKYCTGKENPTWKGMDAGYSAKHKWLTARYGKPDYCENDSAHKSTVYHWANISGQYLREREDYKPLCPSCASLFDKEDYCKFGHQYTKENTLMKKKAGEKPYRQCRTCNKLWARKQRGSFNPRHHLAKL